MSILVTPIGKKTKKNEITKIVCSNCGEKVKNVGLEKDSKVDGLIFRCKKCGAYMTVKTK